jgi:hypothetical protein
MAQVAPFDSPNFKEVHDGNAQDRKCCTAACCKAVWWKGDMPQHASYASFGAALILFFGIYGSSKNGEFQIPWFMLGMTILFVHAISLLALLLQIRLRRSAAVSVLQVATIDADVFHRTWLSRCCWVIIVIVQPLMMLLIGPLGISVEEESVQQIDQLIWCLQFCSVFTSVLTSSSSSKLVFVPILAATLSSGSCLILRR